MPISLTPIHLIFRGRQLNCLGSTADPPLRACRLEGDVGAAGAGALVGSYYLRPNSLALGPHFAKSARLRS